MSKKVSRHGYQQVRLPYRSQKKLTVARQHRSFFWEFLKNMIYLTECKSTNVSKMAISDLSRPDRLLIKGIKGLGNLPSSLYSYQRAEAKANAELRHIGEKKLEKVQTQLYAYNIDTFEKKIQPKELDFLSEPAKGMYYWLNLHGIHEVKKIQEIGNLIGLERLTMRQILDTTERPKVDNHGGYIFLNVKSILKPPTGELIVEQISFLLGKHYVVSFQEEVGDHFESIRNKITEGIGFIRKRESSFLLFQLLDAIMDNYFETIDSMNKTIADMERFILRNPDKDQLIALEAHKRTAQLIKKSLNPFKEVVINLLSTRSDLIKKENEHYFDSLINSLTSALEEINATLQTLDGLTNIYFASLSQKMNEVMKVLTLVATLFIPLTFIAGIYGMNFEYMPELKHKNAYFITLGGMAIVALGMVIYFRSKKWI